MNLSAYQNFRKLTILIYTKTELISAFPAYTNSPNPIVCVLRHYHPYLACPCKLFDLFCHLIFCDITETFFIYPNDLIELLSFPIFRRVRVCVCLYGFASLQNSVHTRLMRPCIACPSRCYDHCRFYKHCRPHTVPKSIYAPQAQPQLFIIHYSLFIIHYSSFIIHYPRLISSLVTVAS